jgi:transposase
VFTERTSVGLDVHARSVVGRRSCVHTGEVFRRRLTPGNDDVIRWVRSLPEPSAVVYQAGPTGFGLARACAAVGIRCQVTTPSKIQRPAGDRVKTATPCTSKLLRLDEIVPVTVRSVEQEAARDLVRPGMTSAVI